MFGKVDFRNTQNVERAVCICVGLAAANIVVAEGTSGLFKYLTLFLRKLPLVETLISSVLDSEVKGAVKLLANGGDSNSECTKILPIPEVGIPLDDVLALLTSLHHSETAAEDGKAFAYTYTTSSGMKDLTQALQFAYSQYRESSGVGIADHESALERAWETFLHTNALNPMMYPSLRKFETEIISMTAWMTNGDAKVVGAVTSGGTESILMAVKTYRDRARKLRPHISRPNMIVSETIHPAFEKAAHYFDVEIIHVKTTSDFRVDVDAVRRAVNRRTILLVGSASQYCHGVVDPIKQLSDLAIELGLPLHVDACFGGFMLPWLEKLGEQVPLWDFRLPGVTSISADVHKYGYSSKGASIILYRNAELRSYQYFGYAEWPGGLFGSPSMAGSRPGGMLASAWTAMVSMGQSGYLQQARGILASTKKIIAGVEKIAGLKLLTRPDMTCLAIVSSSADINILAVADAMERIGGWKMERQQKPDSLHMSVLPQHAQNVDKLVSDLAEAVREVRSDPALAKQGSTGVYGMVAAVPDKSIIGDFIVKFFSALYMLDQGPSLIEKFYASRS